MPEIAFTQEDHDLIVSHSVKINHLCDEVKDLKTDMKAGFDKITDKIDGSTSVCANNRIKCQDKNDEKMAKKVDWRYFGGVLTLLIFGLGIFFKYMV